MAVAHAKFTSEIGVCLSIASQVLNAFIGRKE